MKITLKDYQAALVAAVDHRSGRTFDWSQVSAATWREWYGSGAWVENVLEWQTGPLPPIVNPAKVSTLAWVCGGLVILALGLLALAGLASRDDDRPGPSDLLY